MPRPVTEWWEEPRLSYGRGLLDGYQLGHDEVITEILEGMFGGTLLRAALDTIDATAARGGTHPTTPDQPGSWPRFNLGAPISWPGLDNMTEAQRRTAWRRLIDSWEINNG